MATTSTGGVTSSTATTVTDQRPDAMGRDAFLKLLITQLRYQDPMKPMDDMQFITQLAQFSSLEQMQSMNANLQALVGDQSAFQSVNLIGKKITAKLPDDEAEIVGVVEAVTFQEGMPYLKVEGKDIPPSFVEKVTQ